MPTIGTGFHPEFSSRGANVTLANVNGGEDFGAYMKHKYLEVY